MIELAQVGGLALNAGLVLTFSDLWSSTETDWDSWCSTLLAFVEEGPSDPVRLKDYEFSWRDTFEFLREHLPSDPVFANFPLVFEYRPPLRHGIRMDVVIPLDRKVIVLEFKATKQYRTKDLEQLRAYMHYLATSHELSILYDLDVEGLLVRTRDPDLPQELLDHGVVNCIYFENALEEALDWCKPFPDLDAWTGSATSTLPSIREALVDLYLHGKRPEIAYLKQGNISKGLEFVESQVDAAKAHSAKKVIVVDGVGGSGKTYLGFQAAFDFMSREGFSSVYTSGNDPLVAYIQQIFRQAGSASAMDDCPLVVPVKDIKQTYVYRGAEPQHNLYVFDESQRAWDAASMRNGKNEIDSFLDLGDRSAQKFGSCVILCLYGYDQEIYVKEEGGTGLWEEAIAHHSDWEFIVSPAFASRLNDSSAGKCRIEPTLCLDKSIRSDFVDMTPWIHSFLEMRSLEVQKKRVEEIYAQGFFLRVFRSVSSCKEFFLKNGGSDRTYGFLSSGFVSAADIVALDRSLPYGALSRQEAAEWMISGCRKLDYVASPFICQGLELDIPIVLFAGDLYLKDGQWQKEFHRSTSGYMDPGKILLNHYEVLLSRGRRDLVLLVPEGEKYDELYNRLKDMGIRNL